MLGHFLIVLNLRNTNFTWQCALRHAADLVVVDVEVLVLVVEDLAEPVQLVVDPQDVCRTGGAGQSHQVMVQSGDPVGRQAEVH